MSKLRLIGSLLVAALVTAAAAQATPPGKNSLILYLKHVGAREQLFSAAADGTNVRQLTRFTDSTASHASWSPDGKRIAFARDFDCCGPKEHLDIYTMNADGSALHALGFKGLNGDPVWFPDGKRLLYGHAVPGGASGIWSVAAAGGAPHRVLRVPGDLEGIALSPDGKRVAFIRDRQNASALFLATLGSTAMRQVTPWSLNAKPKLDWSPDGKLILARTDDGRGFTIRPDGSGLTVLTKGPDYCSESFSPDGTKVLFVDHCSTNGLRSHIYSMNADGTGVTRIPGLIGHWVSWGAAQT